MASRGCKHFEADLSAYLDRELSERRAAEVERHLAECAACRSNLEKLRDVANRLASLPRVSAPDELSPALRRAAERRALLGARAPAGAARRLTLFARIGASAAVIVACVYLGWEVMSGGPDGEEAARNGGIAATFDDELAEQEPLQLALAPRAEEDHRLRDRVALGGKSEAFRRLEGTEIVGGLPAQSQPSPARRLNSLGYVAGHAGAPAVGAAEELPNTLKSARGQVQTEPTIAFADKLSAPAAAGFRYAAASDSRTVQIVVAPRTHAEWVTSYNFISSQQANANVAGWTVIDGEADADFRKQADLSDDAQGDLYWARAAEPLHVRFQIPAALTGQVLAQFEQQAPRQVRTTLILRPPDDMDVLQSLVEAYGQTTDEAPRASNAASPGIGGRGAPPAERSDERFEPRSREFRAESAGKRTAADAPPIDSTRARNDLEDAVKKGVTEPPVAMRGAEGDRKESAAQKDKERRQGDPPVVEGAIAKRERGRRAPPEREMWTNSFERAKPARRAAGEAPDQTEKERVAQNTAKVAPREEEVKLGVPSTRFDEAPLGQKSTFKSSVGRGLAASTQRAPPPVTFDVILLLPMDVPTSMPTSSQPERP